METHLFELRHYLTKWRPLGQPRKNLTTSAPAGRICTTAQCVGHTNSILNTWLRGRTFIQIKILQYRLDNFAHQRWHDSTFNRPILISICKESSFENQFEYDSSLNFPFESRASNTESWFYENSTNTNPRQSKWIKNRSIHLLIEGRNNTYCQPHPSSSVRPRSLNLNSSSAIPTYDVFRGKQGFDENFIPSD